MTRWIVDASVAAKCFLPTDTEPFAEEATGIFIQWRDRKIELAVPDHFYAELGSVLWKAVRQGRLNPGGAERAIQLLLARQIPAISCGLLIETALAIALKYQRTVYDCLYVALAVLTGGQVVTADERLVNALGSRFPVRWLGSFSIT